MNGRRPQAARDTAVEKGHDSDSAHRPSVVHDGARFLASWEQDPGEIRGTWLSDAGVLEARDLLLSDLPGREQVPRLASDGAGGVMLAYTRPLFTPAFGATRVRARLTSMTPFPSGAPVVL